VLCVAALFRFFDIS